jgi:hypothetical protein
MSGLKTIAVDHPIRNTEPIEVAHEAKVEEKSATVFWDKG